MWFLFHHKAKTKVVEGGRSFTEDCPSCKRPTKFIEVEVIEKVGVWFVDVLGDTERKFRCASCGDVFDQKAPKPDAAQLPAAKTGMDRVEELAAEQRRRDEHQKKIAARIDDELAELKKKMGR